jgi:hypothetical protein
MPTLYDYRVIKGKRIPRNNFNKNDPQALYEYLEFMQFSEEDELISNYNSLESIMKRMGEDGWELVAAVPRQMEERVDSSIFVTEEIYIFKRPRE